jgi:GTP-binding protein
MSNDTSPIARNSRYHAAEFLKSASRLQECGPDLGAEVAFAGRSNAGKSSALNVITGIRGLARTSKTPGRTQLINLFSLDDAHRLVDLPGYGYAKVPLEMRKAWEANMAEYLQQRSSLEGVVVVMDVRRPLTEGDRVMLDWAKWAKLRVHILLTKADKLSRGAAASSLQKTRNALRLDYPGTTVQLFSALKQTGIEEIHAVLDAWLEWPQAET